MGSGKLLIAGLGLLALCGCTSEAPDREPTVAAMREAANGDLAMPAEIKPVAPPRKWVRGEFDPFKVSVEGRRALERARLKKEWVLYGIVKIGDSWVVLFVEKLGAFKEGDVLPRD